MSPSPAHDKELQLPVHVPVAPILAKTRHLLKANGSIVGREVAEVILPLYPTFASAIPTALPSRPALASIDGRAALTHRRIQDFILTDVGPVLHQLGFGKGDRVALVLPNGPELALAIVATAHWACAVPLNANGAVSELEADLARCGADLVIGPYSGPLVPAVPWTDKALDDKAMDRFHVPSSAGRDMDWSAFCSIEQTANKLKIPFVGLVPSPTEAGAFRLQPTRVSSASSHANKSGESNELAFDDVDHATTPALRARTKTTGSTNRTEPNAKSDEVLVLFTSGTTGNKKLVPHQMGDMLTAATTIALSWDLSVTDVNCNLMPLFHVGGIVRQIFSPIVSGGCVICCPSFDPSIFWALLAKGAFTWYYAAPTMHQLILQTGRSELFLAKTKPPWKLRMIANAAGGLLPSLAEQMREAFGASVSEI
jgi:acyl-coenzyme A synthetase/AMP-(fatty) acid ligase